MYVFIFIGYGNVVERLSELEVLVFVIVELFLVVVDGAEPFPGEGPNDEGVLLDRVLLEGVLLGDDPGVVIVVEVYVVVLQRVVIRRRLHRRDDDVGAGLGLAVLDIVKLLVVVVVEGGEGALLTRADAGRGGAMPLPGAERQDRAHVFFLLLELLAGATRLLGLQSFD